MIGDVVIISPGAVPRLEAMIAAAEALAKTEPRDLVYTRTHMTGWSDTKGTSVSFQPIRTDPGQSRVYVVFDGERMAVNMPLDHLPWNERERPSLDEVTALLKALATGRSRRGDDPIEILADAVAATMSFDPPEPARITSPSRPPRPFLTITAPRFGRGAAHVRWNDLGRMQSDDRWVPSPALAERIAALPEEIGVVQNDDRMGAGSRSVQVPIPDKGSDPVGLLRRLAAADLAGDARMILR